MNSIATSELHLKSFNSATRTAEFIASTDAIDSYDEIVEQSWDLSRFKSNPVILYAHDRRSLPIGKAQRCDVVVAAVGGARLECTIEFATEKMNPEAEKVWQLVQNGFLKAVSVGFRPKTVKREVRDGKEIYVLSDNVLHEISIVPIPANPEALAKMKSDAAGAATPKPATTSARTEDFSKAHADAKALVGVKILENELHDFVHLAFMSRASFESVTKRLPTLPKGVASGELEDPNGAGFGALLWEEDEGRSDAGDFADLLDAEDELDIEDDFMSAGGIE